VLKEETTRLSGITDSREQVEAGAIRDLNKCRGVGGHIYVCGGIFVVYVCCGVVVRVCVCVCVCVCVRTPKGCVLVF